MALMAGMVGVEGDTPWIYGRWVQPPAQGRSERTFFRFLDAAEKLLTKRHWHEVSVQEIVKNAEASVGSFYNRFQDKTALLHCLDDRLAQESELTITHLIDELEACPALISDAPSIVVSLLMRLCTERRGVIRALDLARKLSANNDFTGLGPRFDEGLETLAHFLIQHDEDFQGIVPSVIVRAFQGTFTIARENLLYQRETFDDVALHGMLMRHFHASLQGWS